MMYVMIVWALPGTFVLNKGMKDMIYKPSIMAQTYDRDILLTSEIDSEPKLTPMIAFAVESPMFEYNSASASASTWVGIIELSKKSSGIGSSLY